MEYLHGKSIIHRDLKSLNVLLDVNWTAKIADFGSSRVFDKHSQDMTVMPGCTIAWTAPEVLSRLVYSEKADVYSYAIILWELATNPPNLYPQFQFAHQIAAFVIEGNRPPIPKACPPLLLNLMTSCWNGQPELRPTFQGVLKTIQNFKTNQESDKENNEKTPLLSVRPPSYN
jgi:serine/threonine protein kinase